MLNFIDTHVHLDFPQFQKDREEVIERAQDAGVFKMIDIGCNLQSSQNAINLTKKYENIFATVGVHPSDIQEYDDKVEKQIFELAKQEKVVAIGEVGLDYFHGDKDIEKQKQVFVSQINLAKEFAKPLVIHTREAGEDLLNILKKEKPLQAVIHCFTENLEFAEEVLAFDYMISFTGIITYPSAEDVCKVVAKIPLKRIMIETDCPFLAPQKYRGKRNEPSFVVEVARKIAEIKDLSFEEVVKTTTKNAEIFFKI